MSLLDWFFGVKMPVIPENTWTWRVEAYPDKKPNKPRRVSRKPGYLRNRKLTTGAKLKRTMERFRREYDRYAGFCPSPYIEYHPNIIYDNKTKPNPK